MYMTGQKYRRAMEQIELSPDQREHLVRAMLQEQPRRKRKRAPVRLLLAAALGLLGRWWEPMYLFAGAQLVLGAFNLLPALPLDGGRILWLALAWLTEPYTAQRVLSAVSLAVSLALLLGGGGLIWRLGGSPFLLVGAVGLTGWNLREIKLAKGG